MGKKRKVKHARTFVPVKVERKNKNKWYKKISLHSWRYCVLGEGDLAAEPLYQSSESWRRSREVFQTPRPHSFFLDRGSAAKTLITQYRQLRRLIKNRIKIKQINKIWFSLQCRRFLWARNLLAEAPCWNFPKREGTVRVCKGYYFYSPQSSTVIKSKMAATTTLRTRTRFRPPKIRLHCRLDMIILKSKVCLIKLWLFFRNISFLKQRTDCKSKLYGIIA